MSSNEERNKAVIARYFEEYWGKLNPDIVDEVCADDFFQFYPMHANPKRGKAAAKQAMADFKAVSRPLCLPDVWSTPRTHSLLTDERHSPISAFSPTGSMVLSLLGIMSSAGGLAVVNTLVSNLTMFLWVHCRPIRVRRCGSRA